jgi:DNA-binding transcriptional LysR family regulator
MKSKIDKVGGRIDLNLLVVFDAIYRLRNLTAAGRTLSLSQPAMSHALDRLRTTFKDPLFVRLPRGLQPTSLANNLAPALMEGLAAIRGGLERRTFDPATSTRIFCIGMGEISEGVQLPRLLHELRASAPHVRLHTMQVPGTRLSDALGEGEVDMATGDYELGAACRSIVLYEREYACVVRADHPVIGAQLTLKQFKAAGHILVAPQTTYHHTEIVERALTSRKVNARIVAQISHFHGVMKLITSSDLIATIPKRFAQSMQQYANIKVLPPPISLPKYKVTLYWHERFHRDPGNEWLRATFIKLFKA